MACVADSVSLCLDILSQEWPVFECFGPHPVSAILVDKANSLEVLVISINPLEYEIHDF